MHLRMFPARIRMANVISISAQFEANLRNGSLMLSPDESGVPRSGYSASGPLRSSGSRRLKRRSRLYDARAGLLLLSYGALASTVPPV